MNKITKELYSALDALTKAQIKINKQSKKSSDINVVTNLQLASNGLINPMLEIVRLIEMENGKDLQ